MEKHRKLLGLRDPAPVACFNSEGRSPFLLIGDHAGFAIPETLCTLGLDAADLRRHIACDIGVLGLGEALAGRLGAAFLHQAYSRLVIDCNRDPASPEAIPIWSDGTEIPKNAGMSDAEREARAACIHTPYQEAIAARIGPTTILVSLHSFTPVMEGKARPWQIGVLHDGGDTRFARAMLTALRARDDLVVGDNQPYVMDATDYTVPRHAYETGLPYVELEVRQDLIADRGSQLRWSGIVAAALIEAIAD